MHKLILALLALTCGVARADLIIDVNGVQVTDQPNNFPFIDVSGSADGVNYVLSMQNPGGLTDLMVFDASLTAAGAVSGPLVITFIETGLSPIPHWEKGFEGEAFYTCASSACSSSNPVFMTFRTWLDPMDGGAKVSSLFGGPVDFPPFSGIELGRLHFSGPLAIGGPFSVTDELTIDPATLSSVVGPHSAVNVRGGVAFVPEPGILPLAALGFVGVALMRRRRRT